VHQDIARTVVVASPRAKVWNALLDVQRVASWLSIVGEVREIERLRRYGAVLEDRIGPFALRADLAVTVTAEEPRLRVEASGEDRQVASRITARVEIDVADEGSGTRVNVGGGYDITGKIATLGAGAIRKKGEHVLDEFVANMGTELGTVTP
jgi:carbon monoxide dehydrogenase subunit G